jgi:NAD(P)H-hydrate repair Nnr-like enzyme with NAD(P)H-hydrate epimerase domain
VLPAGVPSDVVVALAASADVVLDGILGTGAAASPALRPPARDVVDALLPVVAAGTPVVAVDLPSGVGPDDGAVIGPVLPALVTVTFGAVKAGLLLSPGRELAGDVRLVDIGLGPRLADVEPLVQP